MKTKPNRPHQVKVLFTSEELKSLDDSVQQTGTNRAEVLRTLLLKPLNALATETPAQSMNIHADYEHCTLQEFMQLTKDELLTLECMVRDALCYEERDKEKHNLDILQSKLILLQRLTY